MSGVRHRDRGQLESEVLRVLRGHSEPVGAAAIVEEIDDPRPAYTTVLTVLDRLVDKGEVVRDEISPRRIRFSASRSEAESASESMLAALGRTEDRKAVLLKFAGDLDDNDIAFLRSALTPKTRD